jgi:hypothetical protein
MTKMVIIKSFFIGAFVACILRVFIAYIDANYNPVISRECMRIDVEYLMSIPPGIRSIICRDLGRP